VRRALPWVLAGTAAVAVAIIAGSIDERYEATASTRVQIIFDNTTITALRALAGLPAVEEPAESPLFPGGPREHPEGIRVIDTGAELVPSAVAAPVRRLKVKAVANEPEAAARAANRYLADYFDQRRRFIDGLLKEARDRVRTDAAEPPGLSPAVRAEVADATVIASDLEGGLLTYDPAPASPPTESVSPRPVRDAIVAGLIGGLVGWLISAGYVRDILSRSKSSRLRSAIASRL
jgi:hypothetical protein